MGRRRRAIVVVPSTARVSEAVSIFEGLAAQYDDVRFEVDPGHQLVITTGRSPSSAATEP